MEHAHDHQHETSPAKGQAAGHDKHAGHSVEMFRNRFWVCLALTIPALIWEPMLQDWFGYRAPAVPGPRSFPPSSAPPSSSMAAGYSCRAHGGNSPTAIPA
jgi:P-type Cu2+ transporter